MNFLIKFLIVIILVFYLLMLAQLADISSGNMQMFISLVSVIIWPFVVIFLVKVFEQELRFFIGRLNKITTPGGMQFEAQNQVEIDSNKIIKSLTIELEDRKNIVAYLTSIIEGIRRSKEDYQLLYFLERTYRLLFGAQISLVNLSNNEFGSELILAESVYNSSSYSKLPNQNSEMFVSYLINSGLILFDSSINKYKATALGSAFIEYLKINNIPLNKQPY